MKALVKIILQFAIIFAGMMMAACNDTIGLGAAIDVSPPVVKIITGFADAAVPGGFISGTKTIYINATDDSGIKSVTVTLYDREYAAYWNEAVRCYTYSIDSTTIADGILRVIVTATDISGKKTVTPELIYTITKGLS